MEIIIAGKETVAAELHGTLTDLQIASHFRHLLSYMHPHLGECFPSTVYLTVLKILTLKAAFSF